jgi:hypothetical protein
LVANAEVDLDEDGFVTVEDLKRVVGPELSSRTGQNLTCRFDGSGDLAVALAPNHPVDFTKDDWQYVTKHNITVSVPPIPAPTPTVVRDEVLEEVKSVSLAPESGVQSISWQLPLEKFQQEVLSAIDSGRDMPLKLTIQSAQKESRRLLESNSGWEELGPILDRVAAMAISFITAEHEAWFTRSMALMNKMYEFGFDKNGYTRRSVPAVGGLNSAEYWYGILQRVMGIGSFAVRSESWSSVRALILQRPVGYEFRHYNNWIRHAVTESARAGLFRREVDGQFVDVSLIETVRDFVTVHDALRPDLDAGDPETLTSSLCQFDALACIVALVAASSDEQKDVHGSQFYPNFARFYTQRSEPAFRMLLENPDARKILAPVEDLTLATVYKTISRSAAGESFRFNGWHDFEDPKIREFLSKYP